MTLRLTFFVLLTLASIHAAERDPAAAWAVEQMPGGTVTIEERRIVIRDVDGCTLWFREKLTAPVVIDTGLIAYGEQIPGPGPEDLPTGHIVCLSNTGAFQWDRPLPAATFCTLACDPGRDYLYYGTASQTGDAGMHCLDTTTQQELWSFPMENFCGGACIAGEGYIAFLHGGVSGVYLTGIRQPK